MDSLAHSGKGPSLFISSFVLFFLFKNRAVHFQPYRRSLRCAAVRWRPE